MSICYNFKFNKFYNLLQQDYIGKIQQSYANANVVKK